MRILRYYLSALLFSASAAALAAPINTKEKAVKVSINAIRKFELTTLSDECGAIVVAEKPLYFEVVVRERHTQHCAGARETGPRLFNVRVRKRDGRLTSDVYDGISFLPVDHKPALDK